MSSVDGNFSRAQFAAKGSSKEEACDEDLSQCKIEAVK